jgi:putative tryptophan/tyrosine transport system substrate-binding protein
MLDLRRRQFITLLAGAAAAWPLTSRAQQADRVRRIGVLSGLREDDPESLARLAAFEQALQALGWTAGRNLRIDYRWLTDIDPGAIRKFAAELAALAPDVILASGNVVIAPMLQAARTTPIVLVQAVDPVGSGFIESMARPGGNVTGFTQFEYSLAGKWLELLKEIAPRVTRVAVMRDPTRGPGIGQFAVIQAMAPSHAVELTPINANDPAETRTARIAAFASSPNGGLIVTVGGTAVHRDVAITAAAKNRLPAIYPYRYFVADGGLISYGPDTIDQYRRAAGYIDRILKGEKPADLPVQAPTKYQLVINLKTAKALGVDVPPTLLARADEVIE